MVVAFLFVIALAFAKFFSRNWINSVVGSNLKTRLFLVRELKLA
jgi:hypothetical protein